MKKHISCNTITHLDKIMKSIYTDNYDISARPPYTKTIKLKVKINEKTHPIQHTNKRTDR